MKVIKLLIIYLLIFTPGGLKSQSKEDSATINQIMRQQLKALWRHYPPTSYEIRQTPYKVLKIDSGYDIKLLDSNFLWSSSHSFKKLKVLPDSSINLSKGYCQISTPHFNRDMTKCIVVSYVNQGEWGQYYCKYLFKKKRKRWKFVMQFPTWKCPPKRIILFPSW